MTSLMLYTDGYKLDHRRQSPPKSEFLLESFIARAGRDPNQKGIIAIGVQQLLDRIFGEEADLFFATPRETVLLEYQNFLDSYLGPNDIGTDHIAALHDLGYLPLRVTAVPEGTYVPYGVPFMTIENTLKEFYWLVNYFETVISAELWMPCTSATTAHRYREILDRFADLTSDIPAFVDFQAHDFSFRGMGGVHAAELSGLGHLASFTGSDNIAAIMFAKKYYGCTGFLAGGVPATEHSVMCAGIAVGSELETYDHLLDVYPAGIVSVVSDTLSLFDVITKILPKLKDKIMARDGKLVIRPDSGDPADILCGDPQAPAGSPERKGLIVLLDELFGHTINSKGYKDLDSHIGAIYGDSITLERCEDICMRLKHLGYASTNVVFGVGSFTYQYVTRDTHYFAIKATDTVIDGKEYFLSKDPATDKDRIKKSRTGRVVVRRVDGKLTAIDGLTIAEEAQVTDNVLQLVWEDSKFVRRTTLDEIRDNVRAA